MNRQKRAFGILIALVWLASLVAVQAKESEPPSRFRRAQLEAWHGKREVAQELCRQILDLEPRHHDARILLARTMAWDRDYELARGHLRTVLTDRPDYTDASLALSDVDLWDDRPAAALITIDEGLAYVPDEPELLYRRARALEKLERYDEALVIAKQLARESSDPRFAVISDRLQHRIVRFTVSTGYRKEDFQEFSDPFQEWHVALKRPFKWGSLIGRFRHARRFSDDGEQYEIDAYPKLPRRMYMYTNIGVAATDPYPELRVGAELYKNFPGGWEASLGMRHLVFESSEVSIYTGSIGKYLGNYWLSLRPTATNKTDGSPTSYALSVRRYLNSRDTYVGGSVSLGSKPGPSITANEKDLESSRLRVEGQLRFFGFWLLKAGVGYREQDITVTRDRHSFVSNVTLQRRF